MKQIHKNQLIFIFILLLGGILIGIIGSVFFRLQNLDQLDLILLPMNNTIDLYPAFIFQFSVQMLYILIIMILGTSLIGTFLISFILFTKGLQIGLTLMMFLYTYEMKGIIGIIFTLIPQVFLEMIPIVIIAIYAIECSNHVLYSWFHAYTFKTSQELNRGLNYLISAMISAVISSYLKATLVIMLIRFFNHF